MFDEHYGLNTAVAGGLKNVTRRILKGSSFWVADADGMWTYDEKKSWKHSLEQRLIEYSKTEEWPDMKSWALEHVAQYKVGDIVAVAQNYHDVFGTNLPQGIKETDAGYRNKMFVKAELMPIKIKIIEVRIERLQDISDDDCIKEGIYYDKEGGKTIGHPFGVPFYYTFPNSKEHWQTPREAYAALIDKISGKGTWSRNPFVFVYSFEKV